MSKKTSRILVYVINTVIIILNSIISFIQQDTTDEVKQALLDKSTGIELTVERG